MRQTRWMVVVLMVVLNAVLFPRPEAAVTSDSASALPEPFAVTVTGGVVFEGTYVFYTSVTLGDVIAMAGGYDTDAVPGLHDHARVLSQDTRITVPTKQTEDVPVEKVNINTATFSELLDLPYMTENRAVSLLVYRETTGPFMTVDDLVHVKNIGPVTLENLRPYVTVG